MIDERVRLIRRIREKLDINPSSKSTLVKREELLQYAQHLYNQNQAMRQILEPSIEPELSSIQRQRQEKNITLVLYETELRDEKYKSVMLENSVKYYQDYIQQNKATLISHRQRIAELRLRIAKDRQTLKPETVHQVMTERLKENETGIGEAAMLNFMNEFLEANQSLSVSGDSSVAQYQ